MDRSTCASTSSGALGISSPTSSDTKSSIPDVPANQSQVDSKHEKSPGDCISKSVASIGSKLFPRDSSPVKAPKAEVEAGAISLCESIVDASNNYSLDEPTNDTPEDDDTEDEDSIPSSGTSSSIETDSMTSLEMCCCDMSCNKSKWNAIKRLCSSANPLRSRYVPRCRMRKRFLFTLGSLCTGLDPISQSNVTQSPFDGLDHSNLSPSPECADVNNHNSSSATINHSSCQSYFPGRSAIHSLTPEESEPMLKNEPKVTSIESSGRQSTSDTRHPVTRSGRVLSLANHNSNPNTSGISGANTSLKRVPPLDVLVNSDDQPNHSVLHNQSINCHQRPHLESLSRQRSPSSPLDTSVHYSPGQLCQVCIPLQSITTSTSVPNQIACYLCHSPTAGHTLDRMAGVTASPGPTLIPKSSNMPLDMNIYATRKTIAQGMLDICLMISNATQLKYILLHAPRHKYVEATIALITLSILLQVIIGIILIFQGRWNINYRGDQRKADIANNIVVILIFLVTVVNVMASAFGPSELPSSLNSLNSASTTATIAFSPSASSNAP